MSEKELISNLRAGSNTGFEYLYVKNWPICKNMMFKMGIEENDRKDIFQDSIIILYEKLQEDSFLITSKIGTLLYGICRHKCLNNFRDSKKKVKIDIQEDNLISSEGEETSDPEILEEIISLGSPCKDILSAFYFHRQRLKELMIEFHYKSENSIKQQKFKCLKRLKQKFLQKQ